MSDRTDANGWSTKVTPLGDGTYGCRVLHNGKVHSEEKAETKSEIRKVLRDLLRWVDKMGFDSPMASVSRMREGRKQYEREQKKKSYEVMSDGKTVWVNGPVGLLGRFSRFGIDVHAEPSLDKDRPTHCLYCTHGILTAGASEWEQFKAAMNQYHGIAVGDEHRPEYTKEDS